MVKQLPFDKIPRFQEVVKELGVPQPVNHRCKEQPTSLAEYRIVSQSLLKDIIKKKRAEIFVKKMETTKFVRGTQTLVSCVAKQHIIGCVNYRSRKQHVRECKLAHRPGFCHICGADGFDTDDCIYPHVIEHEYALGGSPGCSRGLSLFCPEYPDCNIRTKGWMIVSC